MKELANKFKAKFVCLGENAEKCKRFSVPIEKEIRKLIKMVMRVFQLFLAKYNLLIV